MSSGHHCLIRDLGLVKGGKGLRHHEVVLHLSARGVLLFLKRLAMQQPGRSTPMPEEAKRPLRARQSMN